MIDPTLTRIYASLLIDAYPQVERTPCEWCGNPPPEGETLQEVDDSDRSVGYVSTVLMCANCRYKKGIERRSR